VRRLRIANCGFRNEACEVSCPERGTQCGQSLVVLSVALLVLVGMAAISIEVGRVARIKGWLVNVCDCAAIAGASCLPNATLATQEAERISDENGVDIKTISFPASNQIKVVGRENFAYMLAGIWGFTTTQVTAQSVAERAGVVTSISRGVLPLGISTGAYDQSSSVTLSFLTGGPLGSFNFVSLAWNDSSSATYINNLENGYDGTIGLGVTQYSGSVLSSDNRTAIVSDSGTGRALFQQATQPPRNDTGSNYTYPDYPKGDPRIALVVLVEEATGTRNVNVRGVGAFYLSSVSMDGTQITGRFLSIALPATRASSDGTGTDYGVRTYRLIQ